MTKFERTKFEELVDIFMYDALHESDIKALIKEYCELYVKECLKELKTNSVIFEDFYSAVSNETIDNFILPPLI